MKLVQMMKNAALKVVDASLDGLEKVCDWVDPQTAVKNVERTVTVIAVEGEIDEVAGMKEKAKLLWKRVKRSARIYKLIAFLALTSVVVVLFGAIRTLAMLKLMVMMFWIMVIYMVLINLAVAFTKKAPVA